MKADEAFPSQYLKEIDFSVGEDRPFTIKSVEKETLGQGKNAESKLVLYFRGEKKGLVLNKINFNSIAKVTGFDDSDDWAGQKICLYFNPDVTFGSEVTGGIRVRLSKPNKAESTPEESEAPPNGRGGLPGIPHDKKFQWRSIISDYTVMSVSGAIAALSIPKMLYSSLMNPAGNATVEQLERVAAWLEANGRRKGDQEPLADNGRSDPGWQYGGDNAADPFS